MESSYAKLAARLAIVFVNRLCLVWACSLSWWFRTKSATIGRLANKAFE